MTTRVIAVSADDTIDHAIDLMVRHRISGLPVLDRQGRPVGIVSEFDLLELSMTGTPTRKVSQCMSGNLFGVAEEDNRLTIADMFREKHVRRFRARAKASWWASSRVTT